MRTGVISISRALSLIFSLSLATRIRHWSSRRTTPGFMPTIKVKKRAGEGETVRESESQREREREIAGGGREGGAREREREGERNKS